MSFGTRPALARVRVNGASTIRLGKRQSPTARGSSKVDIEVHLFPKCRRVTGRASPNRMPRAVHAFPGYTAGFARPYARWGKTRSPSPCGQTMDFGVLNQRMSESAAQPLAFCLQVCLDEPQP